MKTVKDQVNEKVKDMLEHYDILRKKYTHAKALDMVSMNVSLPIYITKQALKEFKTIVKEKGLR